MSPGKIVGLVVLYLVWWGLWLWFAITPFMGWAVAGGLVLGTIAGLVVTLRVLRPGRVAVPGPPRVFSEDGFYVDRTQRGRDLAWPHYLARQARLDVVAMAVSAAMVVAAPWSAVWTEFVEPVKDDDEGRLWLAWLAAPTVLPLLVLAGASGGVLVGLVTVLVVAVPLLAAATLTWGAVGCVLRRVDRYVRMRNRARARCPSCFWASRLPSYPCPCGVVHRDVRPSLLGVLSHRCGCGRSVSATVSRAGVGRAPSCPQCDEQLAVGSGVWTDVSVPVLGPAASGKTSLIYAGLAAMQEDVRRAGGTMRPRGATSEQRFDDGVAAVRAGRVAKTDAQTPTGLVSEVRVGGRAALLHTFDAAGEHFSDGALTTGMRFLDSAEQMILVVDPFSIRHVADQITPDRMPDADGAVSEPAAAYRTTVLRLLGEGVRLDGVALAVVVVKADLLVGLDVAQDLMVGRNARSAAVRSWLWTHHQDALVTEAERDFGVVRYFLVSSVTGLDPDSQYCAAAPLLWLGERARLPLPVTVREAA